MKKITILSVLTLSVILILIVTMIIISNNGQKHIDEDEHTQQLYYVFNIVDDVSGSDEFKNADIETQMNLFYNWLIDVSEHGTEKYPNYKIDSDSILIDDTNYNIVFCDNDNIWYMFRFDTDVLFLRDVSSELSYYTQTTTFLSADIDSQMEMMYNKLLSLRVGVAERVNGSAVVANSIEVDSDKKVIYYQYEGDGVTNQYSFLSHSFDEVVTPTPAVG